MYKHLNYTNTYIYKQFIHAEINVCTYIHLCVHVYLHMCLGVWVPVLLSLSLSPPVSARAFMFIALLRIIFLFSVYFVIAAIGMSRSVVLGNDFVLCICAYVCVYAWHGCKRDRQIDSLLGRQLLFRSYTNTNAYIHVYICMCVCILLLRMCELI